MHFAAPIKATICSKLFWGFLVWFYFGEIYLWWTADAWVPVPGRHAGDSNTIYVVSSEVDPILGGPLIILPLLLLCGLPLGLVLMAMNALVTLIQTFFVPTFYLSGTDRLAVTPLLAAVLYYWTIRGFFETDQPSTQTEPPPE